MAIAGAGPAYSTVRLCELCAVVDQLRLRTCRYELRWISGRGLRRQSHRHAHGHELQLDHRLRRRPGLSAATPVHLPSAHRRTDVHLTALTRLPRARARMVICAFMCPRLRRILRGATVERGCYLTI